MRTITLSVIAALAATALAGCTVKDVDTPQLAGPSSLARTILISIDRDTLLQDGLQEAAIRLTANVQPGESENVRLRAQVFVDGVAQDFGTLSNKSPITPTTIFYRAPAAPQGANGQVPTTVTIAVTPDDSGDFRAEVARTVQLQVIPPGVILPTNPNLAAAFTFTPATPRVFDVVTFNASATTNGTAACGVNCSYSWNFGDGTTASGMVVAHSYRAVGTYPVTLTVTDVRGAQAVTVQPVPVAAGAPPEVAFTFSPAEPEAGRALFFNASESKAAEGRILVDYYWDFGDGTTASGVSVAKTYGTAGSYVVTLKITDDSGVFAVSSQVVDVEP
jgi:PKD repeat protein